MSVPPEMQLRTEMQVHPELLPAFESLPQFPDPYEDIEATREGFHKMLAAFPADRTGVSSERFEIPRADGSALTVEVYRPEGGADTGTGQDTRGAAPEGAGRALPAVLHFHGGGFALGRSLPGQDRAAIALCRELPAVVLTVEYRLAPEHRYPAGVEDCYRALEWAAERAAGLGIDPARIALTGKSAGGGLSAAVALMARDRGGPAIVHQSLCVPDVDDRVGADEAAVDAEEDAEAVETRVTTARDIQRAWRHYLPEGTAEAEAYAAAARATDLSGLPPAYVLVCDLDPLRDAGLAYARRLMDAGVPVTVRNVPGAWHGFELFAPDTRVAKEMTAHWTGQLREALYPVGG
ncbi:alpha/beta hydrolase [Streptomyces sp. Je 1-4]|uniref:alpha/beta hydrolase n=1 Tax=Streptomyces TaxID=1883 RepID=UPI0021DA43AB|nr:MULTISPECIES: alpha/beta hydrolase [unclassified Streptomyces]UYB40802.1 alpha/beta hydrolase [Streptomyces sp. Je 1-4]UZQ36955.1 alpha/beta hydrolase [Streptomyces sp. Je 1-4] [Streptomyces sp. Je 1-4 4N24]UZQ44372.1 alpha/beta hydrolase [Streptomyces sp. Je 1-4] [Streptomyces sp. Je 1-4 4N24_ara]